MNYKAREGIVLLEIQGVFILAATAEARENCRFVRKINETGAFIWKQISKAMSVREIEDAVRNQFSIDDEINIKTDIENYISCLIEQGYLIS